MRHRQTRHTDISPDVRQKVIERDKHCIFCGTTSSLQVAHFISRAHGGLGIPQNLALLCQSCHMKYDGVKRAEMKVYFAKYLRDKYENWEVEKLVYDKYKNQDKSVQEKMNEIKRYSEG